MTVAELISHLQKLPSDRDVVHVWDGAVRTNIEFLWITNTGLVATSGREQVVFKDQDRPSKAPRKADEMYWCTPSKGSGLIK